jgi:ribosomal protein L30E
MQIYFHDTANPTSLRLNAVKLNRPGPASDIMSILQDVIRTHSPFINEFKYAIERMIECPEMKLVLRADELPSNSHVRVYNAPSASEIGVLIPGNCDEIGQISSRDFVVLWYLIYLCTY